MLRIYIACLLFLGGEIKNKPISPKAKKYIEEAITIIQSNSINRKTINWEQFKQKVFTKAAGANSVEETYTAIEFAAVLSDKHSFFSAVKKNTIDSGRIPPVYEDERVPEDIGYIRIPWFVGNQEKKNLYVHKLLNQIKKQDKAELKGWIVDLRGNFGGNMWPMIVAAGPILGDGIIGYFFDPNNNKQVWRHEKGKAILNDEVLFETIEFYCLKKINPVVAVLTDTITASSGEALTVAFRERNKTKSFGSRTYGVSTGNQPFFLSDGSVIWLTTVIFADRKMNKYGNSIEPDEKVDTKEIITRAVNWIRNK